jgi:hypothetical protein
MDSEFVGENASDANKARQVLFQYGGIELFEDLE